MKKNVWPVALPFLAKVSVSASQHEKKEKSLLDDAVGPGSLTVTFCSGIRTYEPKGSGGFV